MVISLVDDFSIQINLDSELLAIPESGLFINAGSHPSVNLENLLAFLPNKDITFSAYDSNTSYSKYSTSRNKSNIVIHNDTIYQSLEDSNLGNEPTAEASEWMETNIDSLRLKAFIHDVEQRVKIDLGMVKRIINSVKIYEEADRSISISEDFIGLQFEFKGTNYANISINRIFIQAVSAGLKTISVLHDGIEVNTIEVTGDPERTWEDVIYTIDKRGVWQFVIPAEDVRVGNGYIDSLSYDGVIVSTIKGTGDTTETADFSVVNSGVGMGFDLTVFKNADEFFSDNLDDMGELLRATFEYLTFQMFLHNPNNVSNRAQRLQMQEELLIAEIKSLDGDTIASRYNNALKTAKRVIAKVDDTQLSNESDDELEIEITTL